MKSLGLGLNVSLAKATRYWVCSPRMAASLWRHLMVMDWDVAAVQWEESRDAVVGPRMLRCRRPEDAEVRKLWPVS